MFGYEGRWYVADSGGTGRVFQMEMVEMLL